MKNFKKVLAVLGIASLGIFGAASFVGATPIFGTVHMIQLSTDPDNSMFATDMVPPSGSANGIMGILGSTSIAQYFLLGTGLQFNGSNIEVSNVPIANGGTGQTTASGALNALLPSQTSQSGKVLSTNGSSASWVAQAASRSQSSTTHSLNTCFQISTTRDVLAIYSVQMVSTLTLAGGTVGTIAIDTYDDSGCTTNLQTVGKTTDGNTGTLTVGLNTSQTVADTLVGYIQAGKYVKISATSSTGTATFSYLLGQEVQM